MPNSSDQLQPAEAEHILQADLANIVRRVEQGVPLTPSQRRLLEAEAENRKPSTGPRYAPNKAQLARILGMSRQALEKHWKKRGAPVPLQNGTHDIAAWRKFLQIGDDGKRAGYGLTYRDGLEFAFERALKHLDGLATPEHLKHAFTVALAADIDFAARSWGFALFAEEA
jgi:hypothetical protein